MTIKEHEYYLKTKATHIKRALDWHKNNRDRKRLLRNEQHKYRYYHDETYNFKFKWRSYFYKRLKVIQTGKPKGYKLKWLPYTSLDLKNHIESQFNGKMTWTNYGTYWEFDHILPDSVCLYSSEKDVEFLTSWSLSNLRPLEKSLNKQKLAT